MQCRKCRKTFNVITKLFFDAETALCRNCLHHLLNHFVEWSRSQVFYSRSLPTPQQIQALGQHIYSLGLHPSIAYRHVKQDCIQFISQVFAIFKSDGVITPQEEQYLWMLQREFHLQPGDIAGIHQEIQYIKAIQEIRQGHLPTVRSHILLPNTEICYWDTPASYQRLLKASVRYLGGNLVVTNQKVRFVSPDGGFEFPLSKIASFAYQHPGGINLHLTRSQGNGFYALERGEILCEVLTVLLNKHHRQHIYQKASSRAIPQEVKTAVWQRDGGRCVQCKASDYLEFDHVIPSAKGGANTVGNVQVLCRRCNLAKSDRL